VRGKAADINATCIAVKEIKEKMNNSPPKQERDPQRRGLLIGNSGRKGEGVGGFLTIG